MKTFTKILIAGLLIAGAQAQTWAEKVVAAVLVGEAGNQGCVGMQAVAEVVRERSQQLGKTPIAVVQVGNGSHCAFSCLNGTTSAALVRKHAAKPEYAVALQLARQLSRQPDSLGNRTRRATHFTRKEERPWWARGYRPVAVIGDHAFYRLPLRR